MSRKLYIAYCTSGLGNRLRPLASALAYCNLTGRQLLLYWDLMTPNGCLTPFEDLFENAIERISLDEILSLKNRSIGLFTDKGPGHNITREAERFGRDQLLQLSRYASPQHSQALQLDDSNDVVIVYDNDYLSSIALETSIAALRSLRPKPEILTRVKKHVNDLGLTLTTKAVHARGTDFGLSNALSMYESAIRDRIAVDQGEKFFLSTEDEQLEHGLQKLFPNQLLSRPDRLHVQLNEGKQIWNDPDSFTISHEHGIDALVDIYLLSCVSLVVFHPGSTFAEISRHLHGVLGQQPNPVEALNSEYINRCTAMMPRGSAAFELPTISHTKGPIYLENIPTSYLYWETLGYRIPVLERMIMVSHSNSQLEWDAEYFSQVIKINDGSPEFAARVIQGLCPYPEAPSQLAKLQSHIRHSKVLIIGSESYWLELLCALYGAKEITTVEYRKIRWTGNLVCNTAISTMTWDQYLAELPHYKDAYDVILSYSSIEHSGLGRYGDNLVPLGDLYTFYLMSFCLASHGLCVLAVPVGQDLTHFNAHRIYGPLRIKALEQVANLRLLGIATPDQQYLSGEEPLDELKEGWTLANLTQLPLGKLRQPLLCFARDDFNNDRFINGRNNTFNNSMQISKIIQTHKAEAIRDPHVIALNATAQAVGSARFVEVCYKVPFGFQELNAQRINISVNDALSSTPRHFDGIDHCVLHVLLGCGVPIEHYIATLRWALTQFKHVHVLEHNRESSDWNTSDIRMDHYIDNCLNEEELRTISQLLSLSVSEFQCLPGIQSPSRNLLFTISGHDQALNYRDINHFYQQLNINTNPERRYSFSNWNDVYLGTAESITLVSNHVNKLNEVRGYYSGKRLYASCGGFFSLDQMIACDNQGFTEIVMFDVNPHTVSFAHTIHRLIHISSNRQAFLEHYLLCRVHSNTQGRFELDTSDSFDKRIARAAKVGYCYDQDVFNILRILIFARLTVNGLQIWGMRNVSDNRIDQPGRLDIHADQEQFCNSNCLINGKASWLASDSSYAQVKMLLAQVPIKYMIAGIEQIHCEEGDLILASNILDFVPASVRTSIKADIL